MAKAELHLRSCPEKRKKKKKKEKRHSVFLFSLLLVFILSYWPTTLASLRSRPEPYSTSNNNNIQSISIWDFFRNRVILFTARGVFLFRLVCPFRSPLSFTHVRPKNQQAISLWKHFLQNSILGKNFLKKKWSGLCWLDDWPNCILASIRCAMRNLSRLPRETRILSKTWRTSLWRPRVRDF